ncbi:MAG: hypothetical protein MUO50_10085, partial [Longimicrobiales bacterium]|nr:hypothetical protein [Longimicrobiales bacterium]
MSIMRACLGLGLMALVTVPNAPLQAQGDTFEWSGRMTAQQTLEVKGIVGNIHTTLASGDRAEVVARKRGDA